MFWFLETYFLHQLVWYYVQIKSTFLLQQNDEDNMYKQDFSSPTLEDHFDKTILPKVMQVIRVVFRLSSGINTKSPSFHRYFTCWTFKYLHRISICRICIWVFFFKFFVKKYLQLSLSVKIIFTMDFFEF